MSTIPTAAHWRIGLLAAIVASGCDARAPAAIGAESVAEAIPPGCAVLGLCKAPRVIPRCHCYLNADCLGGSWGLRVCMIVPSQCTVNFQPSGKINDGLCSFFWWAGLTDPDQRALAARAYTSYIETFVAAGRRGGELDAEQLAATRSVLGGEPGASVAQLAANTLVVVVGRAEYADDYPHAPGAFHYPDAKPDDREPQLMHYGLARIDKLDGATLTMLREAGGAIAEHLAEPNNARLRARLAGLADSVHDYRGRGVCEYPHPPEHRHGFPFRDAYDCVASELFHSVELLEDMVRERSGDQAGNVQH